MHGNEFDEIMADFCGGSLDTVFYQTCSGIRLYVWMVSASDKTIRKFAAEGLFDEKANSHVFFSLVTNLLKDNWQVPFRDKSLRW